MNTTANENGVDVRSVKPHTRTTLSSQFDGKSTATEAQYERSLEMLRSGEKSTIELRRGGVKMSAASIKELVEKYGYNIARVALRDSWDEWGFGHPRVAVYAFFGEPQGVS